MGFGAIGKKPEAPKPPFKPTAAQAAGYAQRRVAEQQKQAAIGVAAIESAAGVIRELVSAAKSHPLIGCAITVIAANVLQRAKIIDTRTEAFIFTITGVAFDVTVALETVEGVGAVISAIDPFKSGGATPPNPADLIRPSAQTIVENPPQRSTDPAPGAPSGAGQLAALIPKVLPAAEAVA